MYDGSWGTICDGWWDLRDARVVCRMLGFDGALGAPGYSRFGQGSGRILLTFVSCDGTEDNLADCAHAGIERYSCGYIEDAGAICYSGSMLLSPSLSLSLSLYRLTKYLQIITLSMACLLDEWLSYLNLNFKSYSII